MADGGKDSTEKKKSIGNKERSKSALSKKKSQQPVTSQEFLAGQGYDLGDTVGEGSYAKVKLATSHDGQVAIKIIDRNKAPSDFVERFLPRELYVVQKLSHTNIINVKTVLEHSNVVFIVMEYAQGGDLLDYIKANGAIREPEARTLFRDLCSAVKYCHDLDICHRDLKCENLLLHNNRIKVSDFGFSRSCVDNQGKRELSQTYCGSAAYASPEVLQGIPYNPKMYDVWSLGVILYIMVCGSMPYDDSNVRKMLKVQRKGNLGFPARVSDRLSENVKKLIQHMLEADITRRATLHQVLKSTWINTPNSTHSISAHSSQPSQSNSEH